MIKDDLAVLGTSDTYSMAMFMLYKLIEDPEYSAISELPYILDKDNLLSLCTYFGGKTIKIPTLSELSSILHIILIYQYVHVNKMGFEDAVKLAGYTNVDLRKVKHIYNKLSKVLENYDFIGRKKD